MRRLLTVALLVACAPLAPSPLVPPGAGEGVGRDVAYLANPRLEGRATGSAGNDSAAVFLARRYQALGLAAAFAGACDAPPCAATYFQPFRLDWKTPARNVAALLPGSDPQVRGQVVVVGAHYDHIGRSGYGALDSHPELSSFVHPGADDNASGTAGVLELARRLRERPTRRSVLFVNFGAEELGLIGSLTFVNDPPVPLDSMVAMLNLDMVGRLRGGRLQVSGVANRELRALLDSANATVGLRLTVWGGSDGRSDHASFLDQGIPAAHFFTGYHLDYHRVSDTVARVDVAGVERVVDLVEQLTRRLGDRPDRLGPADRQR